MFPAIAETLFIRELNALRRSIELYESDDQVWALPLGITNSAGTLTLHLCGNLQYFIGALYGGTGYVRDRPLEFSQRDVSRDVLLREIDKTMAAVAPGIKGMTPERLAAPFPDLIAGRRVSAADFLSHLLAHFGYHLGQIDYHRRIITGDARTADTVSVRELPEFVER